MKDYSFYIAAAWLLTAVVLGALVLQSLWQARAAERDAAPDA
jgi:heme exporter protein CcmD